MDPTQGLFVALAVLDSKMQTLQTNIACVKKDNQHYEKIIDEEKAAIEKLEEKLKELSAREHKIVANIDNLRQSKKLLQEMETNMKHQLVMNIEKNEEHKVAQRNVLMKYGSIANDYHEIYSSLPWAKERNILNIEIIKKRIEVNRHKQGYSDYVKKLDLFESINNQRVRVTIVAFAKLLVERQYEKNKKKSFLEYEKLIQEEIAQLEQKKKDLSEQITNKAKDAVAKIRERTINSQTRLISNKISSGIKGGSCLSIKERLGLMTLTFQKPSLVKPILSSSNTLNIQSEVSSPSLPVLPSPGQIKNYQPEDVPNDNIPQESTSVTDEVEQQAVPFITCETMEKPSSPAMFEDAEKDMHIDKEPELISEDQIQPSPKNTATTEIPETGLNINDEPTMEKKDEKPVEKHKRGRKRLNNLLNKNETKEIKKIRRVSFKKTTVTASNFERNADTDSNPISQRPTLITEIDFSKKNISQQPDPPTVCESQSQEDERQISSHENMTPSAEHIDDNETPAEYNTGFDSPNYILGQDSNQENFGTPQISSYFSSPAFGGQEGCSQPFVQTPRTDTGSIYNFPMGTANPQITLSPPFPQTHSSEGNKALASFFGGSSTGGEKKTKNFFELF
ncbi:uncharacterized protein isoform X1 [Rhodnius prolixus]|uniref:uncharacterized protein isoform X1 n=1 Tax=Rhodnius prolixus TaxID=13249 RepID=UPI003D18FAD0